MPLRHSLVIAFVAGWALAAAPAALGSPPPNDSRAAATSLGALPADLRGTTVDATGEPDELPSGCGPIKASVWYAFDADESRSIVIALDAAGELDAAIDVFLRERSQITPITCRRTNRRGALTFELDAEAGTSYLIRVAALANSATDEFRLRVIEPERPARFPGERLPRGGANAFVDRLANPDDAWSVRLRGGKSYRINLVSSGGRCAIVNFHLPQRGDIVRRLRCDAYTVFVPPTSGTHTLHVQAPRASRERIRYRLRVGAATADDTAPGIVLRNDVVARGGLRGAELDAVDLYRFSVGRNSTLLLTLRTNADFDLRLLRDTGGRLGCDCGTPGPKSLELRLTPGRYFVVVRARDGAGGRYALRRLTRTVTRADTRVDGGERSTVRPGGAVTLELVVTPAVDGPAELVVERFDPLAGWLFHATYRPSVRSGRASMSFRPPSVGHWRVTGAFEGTRRAAPSRGGTVHFSVEEPLED